MACWICCRRAKRSAGPDSVESIRPISFLSLRLQPRVHRLTLQGEHAKNALVDTTERLAADKALEGFDAERKFP